jgi:hypothetical protein
MISKKYRTQLTDLVRDADYNRVQMRTLQNLIPNVLAKVNVYAATMTVESVEESAKYDVS